MKNYKNILIVRTDRIGDVILSTPVLRVLKEAYPQSRLAFMAGPQAADILKGNPCLDEVIVYDKHGRDGGWLGGLRFVSKLRRKKFDLVFVLHPANRVHLISWLAGIPERIGYNRNYAFLLTKKINDGKAAGLKHEAEYNFDLLKLVGIFGESKQTYAAVTPEDMRQADSLLLKNAVNAETKLIAMHPAASCPSKIWPEKKFTETAQELLRKDDRVKLALVCAKEHADICRRVSRGLAEQRVFIFEDLKLGVLAALLGRACLLISNDSGPVHLAAAVGCPVVDIFGRSQPGLSPKRWGPLDKKSLVLHEPENCRPCLAHNCLNNYKCLANIKTGDVINAAKQILENTGS